MSELSFKILGNFPQVLEINLEPEKILIANGATLLFMDEEIFLQVRDTDGADEVEPEEDEIEEDEEEIEENEEEESNEIESEILEGIEEEPEEDEENEEPEEDDSKRSILDKFISVVKKRLQKSPKSESEDSTLNELLDEEAVEENEEPEEEEEPPPPPLLSIAHFDNQSEFVRKVAFAPITGKVLHLNLAEIENQEIYIRRESFLCARKGTVIAEGIDTDLKIHRADLENLVFSKIEGNSDIFVQAEQSFIEKKIVETEEEDDAAIRVNLGSLLAFETSLRLDLESVETVKYLYSEEEIQTILLKGTGTFWLQSKHLQQTFHRLLPYFYEEKQVEIEEEESEIEEIPEELSDIDDLLAQEEQEESPTEMEWDIAKEESDEEEQAEDSDEEEQAEDSDEEEQEVELPSDFDPAELDKLKDIADLDEEALKKMLGND